MRVIRHHSRVRNNTPWPADSVAVLSHGAGSTANFLARAFPPERLGVAHCYYVEDQTGDAALIRAQLGHVADRITAPVILGGVSLGGHVAAELLASSERPASAVAGLVCLPAWLGPPDDVAAMTAAAAADVSARGVNAILEELDPRDWVVTELRDAWRNRNESRLAAELQKASQQPSPHFTELADLTLPVGVVGLANDPLHPIDAADAWLEALPRSAMSTMARDEAATDRAVFADHARIALQQAWTRR